MEAFFTLLAFCAGNSPVTGEFPAQRPVTRSFDVFFNLRLNKQLGKQSWGCWFETLSRPLWRHCNAMPNLNNRSNWLHALCNTLGLDKMDSGLRTTFANAFFTKENFSILFLILLSSVAKRPIHNKSASVPVMAWHRVRCCLLRFNNIHNQNKNYFIKITSDNAHGSIFICVIWVQIESGDFGSLDETSIYRQTSSISPS